jgi:hypothetical protein
MDFSSEELFKNGFQWSGAVHKWTSAMWSCSSMDCGNVELFINGLL